jgi:hypothetical protein
MGDSEFLTRMSRIEFASPELRAQAWNRLLDLAGDTETPRAQPNTYLVRDKHSIGPLVKRAWRRLAQAVT